MLIFSRVSAQLYLQKGSEKLFKIIRQKPCKVSSPGPTHASIHIPCRRRRRTWFKLFVHWYENIWVTSSCLFCYLTFYVLGFWKTDYQHAWNFVRISVVGRLTETLPVTILGPLFQPTTCLWDYRQTNGRSSFSWLIEAWTFSTCGSTLQQYDCGSEQPAGRQKASIRRPIGCIHWLTDRPTCLTFPATSNSSTLRY